jgi:hydrogenase-4 component F
VGRANAFLSLGSLAAALIFAAGAVAGNPPSTWGISIGALGLQDVLRADSLSALVLLCVTATATLALFLGPGLGRQSRYDTTQLRRYHIFVNLFIAAMLLAVVANNVGVMRIAIEATTIFSAFLIPLTLRKASVEASWKYILISSIGIALAFAGTVLAYFDFVSLSGRAENALNWTVLLEIAPTLHGEVIQLAFIFLLIGYGTKAGIAPMHTWKPDAYGEAPAPLGALMSSALFAVAIYAIIRWKVVADLALNNHYTDNLLIALGLLSLVIAVFSVVLSTNHKRMLAFSSLEHTGLICLGLALGPLGAFAALLHLINHTAAKSMMFFLVNDIERKFSSSLIAATHGLLKVMPWTGALYACGLLFLIGLPPGGLFISEYTLFRAGFAANHPWLMGLALLLLVIAFISFLNHLNRMLYGAPPADVVVGESSRWRNALITINVAVLVVLGLTLPASLSALLNQSVALIAR